MNARTQSMNGMHDACTALRRSLTSAIAESAEFAFAHAPSVSKFGTTIATKKFSVDVPYTSMLAIILSCLYTPSIFSGLILHDTQTDRRGTAIDRSVSRI